MAKVLRARTTGEGPVALNPGMVEPIRSPFWSADLTRLSAMDTSVDLVSLDPHVYDSSVSRLRFRPALLLVAVSAGRLQGIAGDRRFEVEPGQALLLDTREVLYSRVDESVRLLRVVIDHRRVPFHLRSREPRPAAVLDDSPVMASTVVAAQTLLARSEHTDTRDDDAAIAQLVTGMQLGLLEESVRQRVIAGDPVLWTRRELIDQYISLHLNDPDLSPASIADAFGLSLRSIHAAYAGTAGTVTSTIRQQRIQRVQHALADTSSSIHAEDLAAAFGFRDADQLARAFRAVTGHTLRQWSHDPGRDASMVRPYSRPGVLRMR